MAIRARSPIRSRALSLKSEVRLKLPHAAVDKRLNCDIIRRGEYVRVIGREIIGRDWRATAEEAVSKERMELILSEGRCGKSFASTVVPKSNRIPDPRAGLG